MIDPHATDQPSAGPEVALAEVVELQYAGPHEGIGRAGRQVVCRLTTTLPPRCWKSGMSPQEARAQGVRLIEVRRTIVWSPGWLTAMGVAGLLLFAPLLLAVIVLYFVFRRKVRLTFTIRRGIWWRKVVVGTTLALLSLGSIGVGAVTALQTQQWWLLAAGIFAGIVLAICAVVFGRIIGVARVVNEWAYLTGAGRDFLDREAFDFVVPR